jgi:plastocyanin
LAVVSIVLLLGLGSTALVFGGSITRPMNGDAAKAGLSVSQSSSTRINSGNTSSSFFLAMNVVPTIRMVPLGGSANFTVVLYSGGDLSGNYYLSAATNPGLSFEFDSPVAMSGAGPHSGYVRVSSSSGISQGTYQVMIEATGSKGVANQTFDFHVQRNLILLQGGGNKVFLNTSVNAGDSVTWLSMDGPMSDDNNPFHTLVFLNSTLDSGQLRQYESWSHTFTQPGVYRYYDDGDFQITGQVVVSP